MKKETKKQIITNLSLALLVGVSTCTAIMYGRMNQAKKIKESPNNYENLQESRRIDKVSDIDNQFKLE